MGEPCEMKRAGKDCSVMRVYPMVLTQ
jgi:hypothetical protein